MESQSLISIAIPCYNEAKRLPVKLKPYLDYLEKHLQDYEIVLVDDGSTDDTFLTLSLLARNNPKIKVLRYKKNRGRGFGMKAGILASSGKYILETDADLPVSPDHILKFIDFLDHYSKYDLVIGSREHPRSGFIAQQPLARIFAGKVFHIIFSFFFGSQFKDVMCGFKMFRHDAAKEIFKYVYDEKYLAAGEIIFVANKFGYKVKDLPIVWEDGRGSKIRITRDTFRTLWGLIKMGWRNLIGKYKKID